MPSPRNGAVTSALCRSATPSSSRVADAGVRFADVSSTDGQRGTCRSTTSRTRSTSSSSRSTGPRRATRPTWSTSRRCARRGSASTPTTRRGSRSSPGVGRGVLRRAPTSRRTSPRSRSSRSEIAEKGLTEIDGYRLDDGTRAVLRNWPLYKPIIAAVNGFCTAGGMEMLGGCDIRVACPEAKFAVMEPKRGLFAGGGTTVRLPAPDPVAAGDGVPALRRPHPGRAGARDGPAQRGRAARRSCSTRRASTRARMIANAPLAVQATKESALQGPLRRRGRDHAGARAARRCAARSSRSTPSDPATAHGAIAASVEVLDELGKELRTRVREGEPHLERDLPDRGRQGRPEGVRGEAHAGLAGEVSAIDPRTPCIIGVAAHTWHPGRRRRGGRARAARRCGSTSRARPRPTTRRRPRLLDRLDSDRDRVLPDLAVRRRGRRGSRERLGADPRHRHYSGIGGTTTQQLVQRHGRARCCAARCDLALITSAEALATQAAVQEARASATPYSFKPAEKRAVPVGVAARSRSRSRTRCSRRGSRSRCSTTRAAAHLGVGARRVPRRSSASMLAPMTAGRGARTRTRGSRSSGRPTRSSTPRPDNRMVGYPYTKYMVVGDGRRHGGRARRRDARARPTRSASRRPARVPARLVLRDAIRCSSPSTPTCGARRRWRPRAREALARRGRRHRRRRAPRPLLVLRELAALRARRARASRPTIRAALTVTGGLPYHGGPGERLPHALDRGDGRACCAPTRARSGW